MVCQRVKDCFAHRIAPFCAQKKEQVHRFLHPDRLYTYWVRPYIEGTDRINRAFSGVDNLDLAYPPIPWKERAVSLLTGLVLIVPLVNTVTWLAMKRFGNPRPLSDDPQYIRETYARDL